MLKDNLYKHKTTIDLCRHKTAIDLKRLNLRDNNIAIHLLSPKQLQIEVANTGTNETTRDSLTSVNNIPHTRAMYIGINNYTKHTKDY